MCQQCTIQTSMCQRELLAVTCIFAIYLHDFFIYRDYANFEYITLKVRLNLQNNVLHLGNDRYIYIPSSLCTC